MNRSWMRASFAAIATLAMAAPAYAQIPWTLLSPWTMNRGGYFLQTTLSYLTTDQVYDVYGEKVDANGDYKEFAVDLHLEYGLREKLGFAATVPIRALSFEDHTAVNDDFNQSTGFSDLTTSLKYRAYTNGSLTATVQGEIQLPTGYNTAFSAAPAGDGAFGFGGRGIVGFTNEDFPGFVQGAVGYRARSKQSANDFMINFDAGWWLVPDFLLAGHWERNDHTGPGSFDDHMQVGLDARYRHSRHLDVIGGGFLPLGGQDAFAGPRFFFGVAYKGNRLPKYAGFLPSTDSELPPVAPAPRAVTPPPATPPPATPAPADTTVEEKEEPEAPETPETPKR